MFQVVFIFHIIFMFHEHIYTFLYLYVFLVLYQTILSPVGVQNKDSSFETRRYFSYLCSFTYQIYIYCYFLFISTSFITMYSNQPLTKRLVHLVQQFNFQTRCGHQMSLNGIWLDSRLSEISIESKITHNGVLTKELCKFQAVKKISNLQHLQQQHQPLSFVIFGVLNSHLTLVLYTNLKLRC